VKADLGSERGFYQRGGAIYDGVRRSRYAHRADTPAVVLAFVEAIKPTATVEQMRALCAYIATVEWPAVEKARAAWERRP
jgi:hypothetical protein